MKALTQQELQQLVSYFAPILSGARLQEVVTNDRGLALELWKEQTYWLILDVLPNTPLFLVFAEECPFRKTRPTKPVGLFLNSHARNLHVHELRVEERWGRVMILVLGDGAERCELEIRLIPKQSNVLVRAHDKKISWEKPLDLSPPPQVENPPVPRSIEEIHREWLRQQNTSRRPALDPVAQWEKQREKDLQKKRKALLDIQTQIASDQYETWYEVGQFLKGEGHLRVPEKWREYVNLKQSLSWNMEFCFSKAKQLLQKKEGARERLAALQQEIAKLESATYQEKKKDSGLVDLMKVASVRGRKLTLPSGALAYCGRSAADNLSLLRKAKAWDYWLHLKDYPGAHAIIHRQRDQLIPDEEIQEVAGWVARESLSAKSLPLGQRVDVVYVECRFVRPIKGDKLGRVTYHSEKTLSFTMRHS
ncbi:MAG: DUF814 domain-containing protein [Bdellovibrio sp.]